MNHEISMTDDELRIAYAAIAVTLSETHTAKKFGIKVETSTPDIAEMALKGLTSLEKKLKARLIEIGDIKPMSNPLDLYKRDYGR